MNTQTDFWLGDNHLDVYTVDESLEREDDTVEHGCRTHWTYSDNTPNEKIRNQISSVFSQYPET